MQDGICAVRYGPHQNLSDSSQMRLVRSKWLYGTNPISSQRATHRYQLLVSTAQSTSTSQQMRTTLSSSTSTLQLSGRTGRGWQSHQARTSTPLMHQE